MTRVVHIVLISTLLIVGCDRADQPIDSSAGAGAESSDSRRPTLEDRELSVREHVFRAMLSRPSAAEEVCFLAVGWDDRRNWTAPPDVLVDRLSQGPTEVRSVADAVFWAHGATASAGEQPLIRYGASGAAGAVYWVRIIEWIDDDHVRVNLGRYDGREAGQDCTTSVKRRGGKWRMSTPVSSWLQ